MIILIAYSLVKFCERKKDMQTRYEAKIGLNGSGKFLIKEFIWQLQNTFAAKICKYASHRLKDYESGGFEHAFYYGEQRTKTHITAALDYICDSNFMQEYSVEKKMELPKKRAETSSGRVDYLCHYGQNKIVDILIELKQNWIRYYSNGKVTVYKGTCDLHQRAVRQLKSINEKMQFTNDTLFGVAMTILPVFTRYPNKKSSPIKFKNCTLKEIASTARKKAKAHACGYFRIPSALSPIDTFGYNNEMHESYPGVVMIYSIYKCHHH
jgi:hypothetical protein